MLCAKLSPEEVSSLAKQPPISPFVPPRFVPPVEKKSSVPQRRPLDRYPTSDAALRCLLSQCLSSIASLSRFRFCSTFDFANWLRPLASSLMSRDVAGGEHGPRRERYTDAWLLWDRVLYRLWFRSTTNMLTLCLPPVYQRLFHMHILGPPHRQQQVYAAHQPSCHSHYLRFSPAALEPGFEPLHTFSRFLCACSASLFGASGQSRAFSL